MSTEKTPNNPTPPNDKSNPPAPAPDNTIPPVAPPPSEKQYSEADLAAAREQAKKDYEKELKEAEDAAKLSKEEKLEADLAKVVR